MDPELLRLLLDALRNQETTGSAMTGGNWPYDDYGLQSTIGGIGAVDGNAYPYEDWALTGVGDTGNPAAQPSASNAIAQDGPYLPAPRAQGYQPLLTGGPYGGPLSQLQYGLMQRQQADPPVRTPATGEEPVDKKAHSNVGNKPIRGNQAAQQISQMGQWQYRPAAQTTQPHYTPRIQTQPQYTPPASPNPRAYIARNPQPQPVRPYSAPVSQPRQLVSAAPTRTAAQSSLANAINALAKFRR